MQNLRRLMTLSSERNQGNRTPKAATGEQEGKGT